MLGSRRLERCLVRLMPHLDAAGVALTGGVAIEYHLARAGGLGIRKRIADLDFVARRVDALAPEVVREFLLSHYHEPGPGVPKALVQLVDPVTRLRIDIFPDLDGEVALASPALVGGTTLLVLRARGILDHKLRTIGRASATSPVDPKHWRDAAALAELCACEPPPATPHLAFSEFCTDLDAACPRCTLSLAPAFPLAPKRKLFEVLGYV